MPSLQNLEKFKKELNSLGNEPEVLARRGEHLEDVPPPEGEAPTADLEALPSTLELPRSARPLAPEAAQPPTPPPEPSRGAAPAQRAVVGLREPPAASTQGALGASAAAPVPAAPPAVSQGLVDQVRARRGGPGLLRRATERSEASAPGLADAGRPSPRKVDEAPASPVAEEPTFSPSQVARDEAPPSASLPSEEEESSALFLEDFLRSEGEAEESELTAIPPASPPQASPAALQPGSDEELFFTVPRLDDLLGGEEPPPEETLSGREAFLPEGGPSSFDSAAEEGEGEPSTALEPERPFGAEPESAGLEQGLEAGEAPAEAEAGFEAGELEPASEPEAGEGDFFAGLGDLGDLAAFDEGPAEGKPAVGGAEAGEPARRPIVAPVENEEAALGEAEGFGVEASVGGGLEAPESAPREIEVPNVDEGIGFGEELSSLGDLKLDEGLSLPEEPSEGSREGGGGSARRGERSPSAPAGQGAPEEFDDFGLGDISAQLGFGEEEESPREEALNPALSIGEERRGGEAPGAEAPLELSDRDFRTLRATLASLPRNLRLAVEELIGERGLGGAQLRQLVELLVRGASPREISAVAGRILGRRIVVPSAYARRTGLEFEAEKGTFAYRFRQNILPILRTLLLAGLAIGLAIFLGYRFIYRPLHALTLYELGYRDLQRNEFIRANDLFDRGVLAWRLKGWYYRFAEGFIDKKQYAFAAAKYDALLREYPGDRKGIFDYARMESAILGNYPKAEELLNLILNVHMYDRQALLAAGDNYLAWGGEDPSKYELARRDYAVLLQKYGVSNEVLFRMLRYFIKTDNYPEVERLERRFQSDKSIRVDPTAYAELGGYLIDKGRLGNVRDILMRALAVDHSLPEIHFNLARYFKAMGDDTEEAKALQNTLYYLQRSGPLTRSRLAIMIETYDLTGENLYRQRRYLDAEQAYVKGINLYESALNQDQVRPEARFGRLYYDLGDLNYYESGDYANALSLFRKAEANHFRSPELSYKKGYIYYRDQDYAEALLSFYVAAGNFSMNPGLLYATANTLFKRGDYFAAEGYYDNLLNSLERRRSEITNFQPDENPQDYTLLNNLMKVYNNLGVTLNQIGKRSADPTKESQALVDLTKSSESFDQLTRNPTTMQRAQTINLAFINTKYALFPIPGYQLQIYNDLPKDMKQSQF